ncbi:partial acetate---CoA ligase (ADP-forming) subunit alpha, partial [Rhodocyclaceae bacterium]
MLSCIFAPRTIALIGASADEGKLAGIVLRNLRRFRGRLYVVTPRGAGLAGLMVCRSPEELPETVDLAVIVRPAPEVPGLVRALKGKARCAVVVSAGFAEVGETSLQEGVAAAGREAGVRLLGPNCLGVFSPARRLDTFFLPTERLRRPKRGAMAVVSQSGAVLITVLEALARRGIGVSAAVNYGNAVDIDAPEIYDHLADDPDTSVVIAYLESVGDGRRFIEAARRLAGRKPLLILKGGKGERGGSAVFSHTGRLAGRYDVFRSILAQAGIREADDFDTLIDTAHALASCRSATGRRVFILTNAGGPGVLAADACARLGLDLPPLPDAVRHRLREAFPPFYAIGNPTDLTGQVSDGDSRRVLDEVADLYDAFVVIALTGVAGVTLELGAIVEDFHRRIGKPVTLYVEQGGIAARLT